MIMQKRCFGSHIVTFRREIHKSIRLDKRIYRYVMSMDGDDFTKKFENLVIDHAKMTDRISDIIY